MWTWPLFWKAPNGVKLNFLAFYLTLHLEISKSPDLFFLKKTTTTTKQTVLAFKLT